MKNKLQRFAEIKIFSNVLQPAKPEFIDWNKHFGNNNDIILELACGHGDYTLELAKMYPNKNFIGVDIKGARIWKGAKTALEKRLINVAFLRTQIQFLNKYFKSFPSSSKEGAGLSAETSVKEEVVMKKSQSLVSEIWITFPDPFSRKRDAKRRLTSPRFLEIYKKILKPNGIINLKTDDLNLFNYSVETAVNENWQIKKTLNNIYTFNNLPPELQIKTFYEKKHIQAGKQIHYLEIIKK